MKLLIRILTVWVMVLMVADLSAKETKKHPKGKVEKVEAVEKSTVARALAGKKFFNGTPNEEAKYYLYLQCASWCGPCRREMSKVVGSYSEMKEAGLEVIVLDCDEFQNQGESFLASFGATFPGIMFEDGKDLPGFSDTGMIPYATLVKANGEVLKAQHTTPMVESWRELINSAEEAAAAEEAQGKKKEASDDSKSKDKKKGLSPVAKALSKAHTFNGRVNKDAKVYIYLQSAGWCKFCRKEMPEIVEQYKEMKEAGVELVLVSHDQDKRNAMSFLKEFKAKFPSFIPTKKLYEKIPGLKEANGIPRATIVDSSGNVLQDGHGSIALDWREYVEKAGKK